MSALFSFKSLVENIKLFTSVILNQKYMPSEFSGSGRKTRKALESWLIAGKVLYLDDLIKINM